MNEQFDETENSFVEVEEELPSLPIDFELSKPIVIGNRTVEVLNFKNPLTFKNMKHFPLDGKIQLGHMAPLIRAMTGESTAVIDDLSPQDIGGVIKIMTPFMRIGQEGEG